MKGRRRDGLSHITLQWAFFQPFKILCSGPCFFWSSIEGRTWNVISRYSEKFFRRVGERRKNVEKYNHQDAQKKEQTK
jgi:hypothetical protein